jgi:hypothetical protein
MIKNYDFLFKKICGNNKHSINNYENILFFNFTNNEEYMNKINEIYLSLSNFRDHFILDEVNDNFLSIDEKVKLFSVFIFKGMSKISINDNTKDIVYTNSDIVINNITEYYINFLIYYEYEYEEFLIKKKIFKSLSLLEFKKIINHHILKTDNKTIKE